jgi:hypothetical protein
MLEACLVRGTILLSTAAWAAAECVRLLFGTRDRTSRLLWTAGAVLALVHAVAAYHFVHHWSHQQALADTARQTSELVGLAWGGGIYVNYAFLTLWTADALWWWRTADAYRRRSRRTRDALLGVFVFMFINGAVVFARGPARILGVAALSSVIGARVWTGYNRPEPSRTSNQR